VGNGDHFDAVHKFSLEDHVWKSIDNELPDALIVFPNGEAGWGMSD
jgi:hypothetical protein